MDEQHQDVANLLATIQRDREAAKEKERREAWTKYVSLMIVVLAVVTAMGTLRSGSFGSKVLLNQARASDAWAFYQSKSIKRHLAEMEARTGGPTASRDRAQADVIRYGAEEGEVKAQAEAFEKNRDDSAKHGPPLAFGIALLQISIAVASVCLITRRRALWAASGALGTVGIGYLIWGLYFV
jgi:hypothetical protein